ncbi:hypothetical protein S40293_11450 [Stachybotrys chartarum IBT 40293]|nr:hypothetical protein S40293_11450 [Stachybotrys chartarum IBT 40293]
MAYITKTKNSSRGQEGTEHDADVDSLFDADTLCDTNSLSDDTTLCDTSSLSDAATLCDTNSLFDPATLYGDAKSQVDVAQSDPLPPETMVVIVVGSGNSIHAAVRPHLG